MTERVKRPAPLSIRSSFRFRGVDCQLRIMLTATGYVLVSATDMSATDRLGPRLRVVWTGVDFAPIGGEIFDKHPVTKTYGTAITRALVGKIGAALRSDMGQLWLRDVRSWAECLGRETRLSRGDALEGGVVREVYLRARMSKNAWKYPHADAHVREWILHGFIGERNVED